MKANEIGGYFELELNKLFNFPHYTGELLNSGRNSLGYIIQQMNVRKIHIPYYTCNAILEPLAANNVQYEFYRINEKLELAIDLDLKEGEYVLYTNYFGIKDLYLEYLSSIYTNSLIIDNSQALYTKPIPNIPTFYSPRKFVGIPDGGVAYCKRNKELLLERDHSYDRCSHSLIRYDTSASEGYSEFQKNSASLINLDIKRMSNLTIALINNINFEFVKQRRMENFNYLHQHLSVNNRLCIDTKDITCPMVYPFWTKDESLRNKLIENKVYVATYWTNVIKWCGDNCFESMLVKEIIPIPIDQRYGIDEMEFITNIVRK